jgi:hypothetical protein
MNNYVFAYKGAPLTKINITTKGSQIRMSGKIKKLISIPFRITGDLSATNDGKIRIHATAIKAAGIPVKGLMRLFGLELAELINANQARGVKMDDNDIIMDPELVLPPPIIRGRITAIGIQGDEVVQSFGGNRIGEPKQTGGVNYMHFWGGVLRFGKLTMNNADLKIVDSDPKNSFDFSLDNYNRQLVAGYSKNTPSLGLVVYMPDYNKLRSASASKGRTRSVAKGNSKS